MEANNDPKKRQKPFTIVFFLLVIFYLGFILSRSLWQNYRVNQDINNLEERVASLEDDNQRLKHMVLYYQTDSFREKEARRKLMMKMPGEKVLALPDVSFDQEGDEEERIPGQKQEETIPQEPNYQLWLRYIFG